MTVLVTVAIAALLLLAVAHEGVDSRPADADRATRWWPGTPRN